MENNDEIIKDLEDENSILLYFLIAQLVNYIF